jgi:tripartite-type tricarboxylate transporter receptor subunit TctC
MKKLFLIILLALSNVALAKETVTVIFNLGQANSYVRLLIDQANKIQDDWQFVLETMPGAGGAIGVNWVINNKKPTILASSGAFFIRPTLYPTTSYNLNNFRPIFVQCSSPMYMVSKKYTRIEDGPGNRITVGVAGLGTTSHLIALELQKKYPTIDIVPYNGQMSAVKDVLSDSIDMSLGMPSEMISLIDGQLVQRVDISKTKSIEQLDQPYGYYVTSSVAEVTVAQWRQIFKIASQSALVKENQKIAHCKPENLNYDQLQSWYANKIKFYQSISHNIKVE